MPELKPTPETDAELASTAFESWTASGCTPTVKANFARTLERQRDSLAEALRKILKEQPHKPNCATQQWFFSEARRAEQEAMGCTCWKHELESALASINREVGK